MGVNVAFLSRGQRPREGVFFLFLLFFFRLVGRVESIVRFLIFLAMPGGFFFGWMGVCVCVYFFFAPSSAMPIYIYIPIREEVQDSVRAVHYLPRAKR